MEKINVIYYNSTLLKGGTDTYMLEVIRNINKDKFQVDVIIKDGDIVDEVMLEQLKSFGSNVFLAKGSFAKRILFLRNFFKSNKNKYQVAHINATSQGTGIISYFAKKNGKIPKVIFHSHMGGNDHKPSAVDKIGAKLMFKHSDKFASCSGEASKFMYGKAFETNKIFVLNNSVDTKKFEFNQNIRNAMRKEWNVSEDTFVVLHAGRFAPQKNHKSLILIFKEILHQEPNSKLFLIGDGVLMEDTKQLVKTLELEESVVFLGLRNNVYEFMSMADCFVMPSIHEGLPIVAVEAQASDLCLVLSNNISKETKLADNVEFVDLDAPLETWAKLALESKKHKRHSNCNLLKDLGFDKSSAIKIVEKLYSE